MRNALVAIFSLICILALPGPAIAGLDCGDDVYQKLKNKDLAALTEREYDYLMRYKSACENIEKADKIGKNILTFGAIMAAVLAPIAILALLMEHFWSSKVGDKHKEKILALGAISTFLFLLALLVVLVGLAYPVVIQFLGRSVT